MSASPTTGMNFPPPLMPTFAPSFTAAEVAPFVRLADAPYVARSMPSRSFHAIAGSPPQFSHAMYPREGVRSFPKSVPALSRSWSLR